MAEIVYALCALTSFLCAWLLLRSYRHTRHRLLFWSGICFVGLTLNNTLLFIDRIVLPAIDLTTLRLVTALLALLILLYGLIMESE